MPCNASSIHGGYRFGLSCITPPAPPCTCRRAVLAVLGTDVSTCDQCLPTCEANVQISFEFISGDYSNRIDASSRPKRNKACGTPWGAIVSEVGAIQFSQLQDMDRKCFVLLEDKTVAVYGVTAPHSATVVRAFAGQRALIFLADSSRGNAEAAARQIIDAGGVAEAAEVDLFDRRALEEYTAELVEWTGSIDVAVVAIGGENAGAQLTAAGMVAERMAAQGSGIIVIMSAMRASEGDYWQLAERATAYGVAVLPIFCDPDPAQSRTAPTDRVGLS